MSENEEELTVDDGHPVSAFQLHRESSYKKREVYEKLVASKKTTVVDGASSSSIMAQSVGNPGPTSSSSSLQASLVSRPSRQSAAKRESNSSMTSAMLSLNGPPSSFASNLPDCKPYSLLLGENILVECSLLKRYLLLLKDALSKPDLSVVELQTLTHDVRKAREVLVEKVAVPLNDFQRELQEQISHEHIHSAIAGPPVHSFHELRNSLLLPPTPTATHPYPSHLYMYPGSEQLTDRRNPLSITDQSCVPYNAQPAH
ncbi:uncharacterized protein LOC124314999 [Daphnia pulicaria]|jgi:hypothetical protein|uniref:uncharacterized protein LOC124314999 n=1 Tax=Daphnia pulicaria TaxID=35523 RepID=UPI001EEA0BA5|nr:uncharacterized protein LOC124314999 [Daphnia pulicaria]XP_046636293.1 uncharacterized protein LOC124314999 [Daphnia pulicaria]XP_046636294.1 uncharacterized protein LOC124314999 [Daphnia pulicaria]